MGAILSYPKFKAFDSNGEFLIGGKLYTFEAGTSTPKATYSDKDCTIPNTNPVILDAEGEAVVYLLGDYKLILTDPDDVALWTMDNVSGVLGGGLSDIPGDLDDIDDGTYYAKVAKDALSSGMVLLSEAVGFLDDIANGAIYGKVLLSDLDGGHILLGNTIGNLDDIDDGSTYGKVLLTDISAGHILLAEADGDLDDIDDGSTYGKILLTDISAGHILLAAAEGDLDDIADGTNYGKIAVTDISSGHIILASAEGDLDDVDDGTNYGKVALTQISAGEIIACGAAASFNINSSTFGNEGIQLQYNGGSPRAYVGDGSDAFWKHDGVKLTWRAANTELNDDGNINVGLGGDIILTGSTTDWAKLYFKTTACDVQLYCPSSAGTSFVIEPTIDDYSALSIGGSNYWGSAEINTRLQAALKTYEDANNEARVRTLHFLGSPVPELYCKRANVDYQVFLDGPELRAYLDSQISLGKNNVCFTNIFADAGVTSCSDKKFKKNISQETLGLDFINSLVPITWNWNKRKGGNASNKTFHGFLAQDVEQALIESGVDHDMFAGISKGKDDDGSDRYGLIIEQLLAPFVKGFQDFFSMYEQHLRDYH